MAMSYTGHALGALPTPLVPALSALVTLASLPGGERTQPALTSGSPHQLFPSLE